MFIPKWLKYFKCLLIFIVILFVNIQFHTNLNFRHKIFEKLHSTFFVIIVTETFKEA